MIIIFGTNILASHALALFQNEQLGEVAAFTVDRDYLQCKTFQGLPVIPYDELIRAYPPREHSLFVAIGYGDLNRNRQRVMERVTKDGYTLASCISKRSNVMTDSIGQNAFINCGATVDPFVKIGNGVFIFSNTYIAHGCTIEDFSYFSGGVITSGSTHVGRNCTFGSGVVVGPHIKLGAYNIFCDGSLVCRSTDDYEVYLPEKTSKSPLNAERMKSMMLWPVKSRQTR